MSDAAGPTPTLESLAAEAWILEPPMPSEMSHILRDEAGLLVDRLLTCVARGRGALDVAIGELLDGLSTGNRLMALGWSGLGDYAREVADMSPTAARNAARLGRELRERPLLAAAVRSGEVSARKALTVLQVARGGDEEAWVRRARDETVRALEAAVRGVAGTGGQEDDDESWERYLAAVKPDARTKIDRAMALAGKALGATAPRWERLEAICQEFVAAHPVDPEENDEHAGGQAQRVPSWVEGVKAWLEEEMNRWSFLAKVDPVAAPPPGASPDADPLTLDDELRRHVALRARWDELLGHLAMLFRMCGLWRDAGFATFSHYVVERLWMSPRAVEQRIALERRLHELPALRAAMREGRISYEKARLVASCASDRSVGGWIARAEKTTCISLRREIDADRDAQMCARATFDLRMPHRVATLLGRAIRAARASSDAWLTEGECLERLAEHFIETWEGALAERSTPRTRALARDRGLCQVPGCSRAAKHVHHVRFRSRGGDDGLGNLVSMCIPHHLHGIHEGFVRVRGRAPGGLTWEVVLRRDEEGGLWGCPREEGAAAAHAERARRGGVGTVGVDQFAVE